MNLDLLKLTPVRWASSSEPQQGIEQVARSINPKPQRGGMFIAHATVQVLKPQRGDMCINAVLDGLPNRFSN